MLKRGGKRNVPGGRFAGRMRRRGTNSHPVLKFWPDERPKRSRWSRYLPLWAGAALLGTAYGAGRLDNAWTAALAAPVGGGAPASARFSLCHTGGGYNCVVDGDTIWFKGQNIRVADIDAPETHEPRCREEAALGDRATRRLHQLVNSGTISLESIDRDEDRYGRKLRIVEVNGVSVGDTLVGEGLARWYEGGRRPWC